jgi:hypothetical protein
MITKRVKITNISDGPRGFHEVPASPRHDGSDTLRVLERSETTTAVMREREIESARNTGDFKIEEEARA